MFRALLCSSSGGQNVLVQRLVRVTRGLVSNQSCRNLRTEQSPKESDDTRRCTNTLSPPKGEHNSVRNM